MEKKKIKLDNSETLAYIEQGTGKKVLILVHGNMSSSLHFLPLFNKLDDSYRLIAVDLRGFGDSSYENEFSSLKELSEDLALFVKALNIPKAYFLGWSTGGGIVMELAAMYPKLVEKIILLESASHKGYPIFQKDATNQSIIGKAYASKKEMAADPVQVAPVLQAFQTNNIAFMTWLWNITIYPVQKPSPEENVLYMQETMKQRNLVDIDWSLANINMSDQANAYGKGDGAIHKIVCPSLHIWSKNDIVVPYSMVQENYEALKPRSHLKIYEVGGHSPLVDNLMELVKDINSFCE